MTNLTVKPQFKSLISPLSDDEFNQLEENILAHGCRDAIKHWKGIIIDGHNRYAICQKHNLPYQSVNLRFTSNQDATVWIIANQLGRRNLTDASRIKLALKKANLLRDRARNNRGQTGNESIHLLKIAAKEAGVSTETVHKYMKITEHGTPRLLQQLENGEIKIGTAYRQLQENAGQKNNGIDNTSDGYRLNNRGNTSDGYRLIVDTKTIEELYRCDTGPDIDNPYCERGFVGNIEALVRMYRFFDSKIELLCLEDDEAQVDKRLMRQLKKLEGML